MMEEVLKKHKDFWTREKGTGPLINTDPHPNWKKKPFPAANKKFIDTPTEINPKDIDPIGFLGLNQENGSPFVGNRIYSLEPLYPQAWMEALIGCTIWASSVSTTSKPTVSNDLITEAKSFSVEKVFSSEWYYLLQDYLELLTKKSGNEIGVSQFHYRGIIDMLAAALGEARLCIEVFDHPLEIHKLAQKYTDLYIQIVNKDMEKRGLWKGGQVCSWGLYAPGRLLSYQIDASNLFSSDMYMDTFLRFDNTIISAYPYSLVHTHYTGLHIIDALLKIDKLNAIQINLDREAVPNWSKEKVIDCCHRIQEKNKSVIIHGELTNNELSEFTNRLKPEGLAIFRWKPINK